MLSDDVFMLIVLIPLNSGLVFTYRLRRFDRIRIVLIPLNSGLVFTSSTCTTTSSSQSLNPFEFRAGIYLKRTVKDETGQVVLIPLNSGLVFTCLLVPGQVQRKGLNPFEFRAGIYF